MAYDFFFSLQSVVCLVLKDMFELPGEVYFRHWHGNCNVISCKS